MLAPSIRSEPMKLQTQPKPPAPVTYDESLAQRCFPHKFRKIGDPYGYLNSIGIAPILEYIYKGHMLIDVAEATDVPMLTLENWIRECNYTDRIEDAQVKSAEGFLADGLRRMRSAPTDFELRRAKEMTKMAQFLATKKDKAQYGEVSKQKGSGGGVTYEFHIGAPVQQAAPIVKEIIEAESRRLNPMDSASNGQHLVFDPNAFGLPEPPAFLQGQHTAAVDLAHTFGLDAPKPPELEPKLVAERPNKPSAAVPDVGPFYHDPLDLENRQLPEHYTSL